MISAHQVAEWRLCREWLLPALEDLTERQVLEQLAAGQAQLWRGDRSAMVTQLVNREARTLHVLLGGGDLRELLTMQVGVAAWGRAMGAQFATINGRPGWARVLARHGFELRDGELWKPLSRTPP